MRIERTINGKYNIIAGNSSVLFQSDRLTDTACVLEYLNLSPMSALEKSIARQAVFNWDNENQAKAEAKAEKKAKAKKKLLNPKTETTEPAEKDSDQEETEISVPDLPEV